MIVFLLQAFFSTSLAFVLSSVFGSLQPWIAVVSLAVGYLMARSRAKKLVQVFPDLRLFSFSSGETGVLESLLTILVLYFGFRHFAWMLFTIDSKVMTLHANNFGDLPLHINYIREMALGLLFPPVNPGFASETLRYPFGPDLYSALWETVGVPLSSHLFLIGLACTAVTATVLRWFGGWWALGAFFFSGGIAGWSVFQGMPLAPDLTQGVEWKNLFLSVFVTQRGVLFALPAGLLLIEATRRQFAQSLRWSNNVMTTLGLLWGFLPLFHVHAFVVVSLMMAGLALSQGSGIRSLKTLLLSRMAVVAYVPAMFFVLRSSDSFKKAGLVRIDPWWTSDFANAGSFLLINFGPWLVLPLALLAALLLCPRHSPALKKRRLLELALYTGLFIFFYNVMLAPWSWDNIKLLIFPYLGFSRLAWVTLDPILPRFSRVGVACILFFSGFLAVERSIAPPIQRGLMIYSSPVLASIEGALKEVPLGAVFAAAPTHDHPLTYFGRLRAVGYEGHLWSHGIDYKSQLQLLDSLMRGEGDAGVTARRLGVTHIIWSSSENAFYQTEPTWPSTFKNVSRVAGVSIYEVPR